MFLHIAHSYFFYISLPIIALAALWRWYYYKKAIYNYSSLVQLSDVDTVSTGIIDKTLFLLRFLALVSLVLAISRLQIPDERSKMPVEGVDIMLVLDVSNSMQLFDNLRDTRSRIEVARSEALKFIQKRENDPIGLVIFAKEVVSRCPLTLDKNILKNLIEETHLGIINAEATMLSQAILSAANRLKLSKAKSKIMIVLTDGEPSPGDVPPQVAIDMAKKLGIKIYTIGIGGSQGGYINHPFWGVQATGYKVNTDLLKIYAQSTGGQFFEAKSPKDMENIYSIIDMLEKTEQETPIFARYFDFFIYFLWFALALIIIEIILTCTVWLSL